MDALIQTSAAPVGEIRQFGRWGPEYEILAEAKSENGIRMARFVLVRTGEELNYPVDAILLDPEAA